MLRGEPCLVLQHGEIGQVLVPFDQAGFGAEAGQCVAVQRPHGGIDALVVRVDQQVAAQPLLAGEAGQVQFAHRVGGDAVDEALRVEAVVDAGLPGLYKPALKN